MVKKIVIALLLLVLPLSAMAAENRVFDNCDLFSAEEEAQIQQMIEHLQSAYAMDFVVLTDDGARYSADDSEAERYSLAFGDQFYDQNGFGVGEEGDGFLYFIDMSNRMPTIVTPGAMIDYLPNSRLDTLLNQATAILRMGDYDKSALSVLTQVEMYLKAGIPEGQYRYDVITGQRLTARHKALTSGEIAAAVVIGLAVAAIFALVVVNRYKLKGGAYRYSVEENHTQQMLDSADEYLTSTVSRIRKPDPPSGGSSGSRGSFGGGSGVRFSGGRSHGGRSGGRF